MFCFFGYFTDLLRECRVDIDNISNLAKNRQLWRTLSSPKDIHFISSKQDHGPPKLKIVFVFALNKLKCMATLGELCLQTDVNNVNFCACHKVEEQQGTLIKKASVGKDQLLH